MSRFFTVALETWKKQVKSISFWLMVFMPFIIVIVSAAIGYFASSDQGGGNKVAIVGEESLQKLFIKNDIVEFVFEDEKKAIEDLDNKKISAYVLINEQDGIVNMDYYSSSLGQASSMYIETVGKNIQNSINSQYANLSNKQSKILTRNPVINFYTVEDSLSNPLSMALYFILMMVMYVVLILYSNIMIMDVAVEKGTKMLEFIFSSIKPKTYFAGKIAGNFLVILTHAFVYIVVGAIGFAVVKFTGIIEKIGIGLEIPENIGYIILEMLGFVVLGLLIYMIVAAMLGSLVSKQEDASKMSTPIMLVPIICYMISMMFIGRQANLFIRILSYMPFFSTFFMPMRLIFEDANLTSGFISLIILLVSVFIVYFIASKVYKDNILNYSSDKLFGRNKTQKIVIRAKEEKIKVEKIQEIEKEESKVEKFEEDDYKNQEDKESDQPDETYDSNYLKKNKEINEDLEAEIENEDKNEF